MRRALEQFEETRNIEHLADALRDMKELPDDVRRAIESAARKAETVTNPARQLPPGPVWRDPAHDELAAGISDELVPDWMEQLLAKVQRGEFPKRVTNVADDVAEAMQPLLQDVTKLEKSLASLRSLRSADPAMEAQIASLENRLKELRDEVEGYLQLSSRNVVGIDIGEVYVAAGEIIEELREIGETIGRLRPASRFFQSVQLARFRGTFTRHMCNVARDQLADVEKQIALLRRRSPELIEQGPASDRDSSSKQAVRSFMAGAVRPGQAVCIPTLL